MRFKQKLHKFTISLSLVNERIFLNIFSGFVWSFDLPSFLTKTNFNLLSNFYNKFKFKVSILLSTPLSFSWDFTVGDEFLGPFQRNNNHVLLSNVFILIFTPYFLEQFLHHVSRMWEKFNEILTWFRKLKLLEICWIMEIYCILVDLCSRFCPLDSSAKVPIIMMDWSLIETSVPVDRKILQIMKNSKSENDKWPNQSKHFEFQRHFT
jgi:hypothetical protein